MFSGLIVDMSQYTDEGWQLPLSEVLDDLNTLKNSLGTDHDAVPMLEHVADRLRLLHYLNEAAKEILTGATYGVIAIHAAELEAT